ncbi:MmcB family DNA repair protein [Tepidamorphus sp. 3E244]|uniref:MmcB family DNA repair protein n=1 Tax=Tepidamorphus sp. 3E244 TaxID=3385498 RepID=UPI0038FC3BDD
MPAARSILAPAEPPVDGRQSERALDIQRGVRRWLRALGMSSICEVTLRTGRRADVMALSEKGEIWIVEIKSSVADFRADRKWPGYCEFCDRFFFATLGDVPADIFPEEAGLLVADAYGAELLRDNSCAPLPPARRKAVTLLFARSAANTLHTQADPHTGF